MAENVTEDNYRLQESTCRDNGRFVSSIGEVERFLSHVRHDPATGHWLWTGATTGDGYGQFRRTLAPGIYVTVRAHRYAWELFRGPIPEGLTLDHLTHCLEPACVRPTHLEPVSNVENLRRRWRRDRDIRDTTCDTGVTA